MKVTFFFEQKLDGNLTDEEKIIQMGKNSKQVRIRELVESIGFSRNTATRKMNILVKKKMFDRRGKGAGVIFIYRGRDE